MNKSTDGYAYSGEYRESLKDSYVENYTKEIEKKNMEIEKLIREVQRLTEELTMMKNNRRNY